ncbi:hypothetical protein ACJRO7_033861 [Eucalyptus globulus]|uniref:Uncharacterized protein n=1 Tax=Eucalyptus globulus TaxID=34317 RepID=A0ABD3J6T0_EUCGL
MAPPPPYPHYPYWYPPYPYAAPSYPYPPPKALVCSKAARPPPLPPNWHWRGWVPYVCRHDKPPQSTQLEDILIDVRRVRIEAEPSAISASTYRCDRREGSARV